MQRIFVIIIQRANKNTIGYSKYMITITDNSVKMYFVYFLYFIYLVFVGFCPHVLRSLIQLLNKRLCDGKLYSNERIYFHDYVNIFVY